jgi:hypothetical protein
MVHFLLLCIVSFVILVVVFDECNGRITELKVRRTENIVQKENGRDSE